MANSLREPTFKIILSKSLEGEREVISCAFLNAQTRLTTFAGKFDWNHLVKKPFIKEARIFDSKVEFDKFATEFLGYPPNTKLPELFSAALEKEALFALSPKVYKSLYPDGQEPDSFEKLITHEMAHRLHVRILNGNEEEMGPIWFFEGFAIYAADQFADSLPNLSEAEIWTIVESPIRGSYKKYATVFRFFLNKTTLFDLISYAAQPNFVEWLHSLK